EYVGFWVRFFAAFTDSIIISVILLIITSFFFIASFGYNLWFSSSPFIFPLYWIYHWLFTGLKGQTPGKMALGIKVVDGRGNKPGLGIAALREILGKTISTLVFCIGFLWIGGDESKQGWHDKIADTYVVKAEKAEMKKREEKDFEVS
ncbi:RDD family protein, partial [Chloroflexota bacterium]